MKQSVSPAMNLGVRIAIEACRFLIRLLNDVEPDEPSEEDKALRGWSQYLTILAVEIGSASIDLARQDRRRPAYALCRCVYEYSVKARFYLLQPRIALLHMASVPLKLEKMTNQVATESEVKDGLAEVAAVWRDTYPELTDKTESSYALKDMLRKVVGSDVFDEEYARKYGLPSTWIHGSGFGLVDVMRADYGDSKYTGEKSAYQLLDSLHSMLIAITGHYDLDLERLYRDGRRVVEAAEP